MSVEVNGQVRAVSQAHSIAVCPALNAAEIALVRHQLHGDVLIPDEMMRFIGLLELVQHPLIATYLILRWHSV